MNIAAIFAGGSGVRMHTKSRPKQFLELNGKPIIIYTLELFDNHPEVDAIVVACIEAWIPFLKKMIRKFEINKVVGIVPGGNFQCFGRGGAHCRRQGSNGDDT